MVWNDQSAVAVASVEQFRQEAVQCGREVGTGAPRDDIEMRFGE